MLQVKRLQLETPDWNAAGHPSQARRPDDGFEAVFHTIRQDFSESARTAAPRQNSEGQRRIEEVKPEPCGKKEKRDGEMEPEFEAENMAEEPMVENGTVQAESEVEPAASELPMEETVQAVEEMDPQPAVTESTAADGDVIVSPPVVVTEAELLLRLAGQANAKMVQEQIAGWKAAVQPDLVKPQTEPKADPVAALPGKAAMEMNLRSEASVLELELPAEPAAEEKSSPEPVVIKEPVMLPQTGDKAEQKPAVMAAVPVEKEQPQPESKPAAQPQAEGKLSVGEEEKHPEFPSDSPSEFSSESRRHTGSTHPGEKPMARGYAEAAQAAVNQAVPRSVESEKKQTVSVEAVSVDGAKNLFMDKGHSVPKSTPAVPAAPASAMEMQENMEQVVKSVQVTQSQGGSRVQLRLDPPELGMLRIEMRQTENGLMLQMQASTPKAQQMLQQNSGELRAALESQGFANTQIEVQLRLDLRNDSAFQDYRETEQEAMYQQADQFDTPQQGGQGEHAGWQPDGDVFPEEELIQPDLNVAENGKETVLHPEWQELAFASLDIRI